MATLQTLDRGLKALFLIGGAETGLSVADIAVSLKVDRAIAYRIVATLEENGLVVRKAGGKVFLGAAVLNLERQFIPQLRNLAKPHLDRLANATNATAFLCLAENDDCIAICVAEPERPLFQVRYQVSSRHPLGRGAPGLAILASRPEQADDPAEVRQARAQGYAMTKGALQKGAVGVASPVCGALENTVLEASVGVVALEDLDVDHAAKQVMQHAQKITELLKPTASFRD